MLFRSNRKIGDLWFKTDEGNKMFVWTGSWTETKLDHQALSVGKLSAISADLGNVTAGDIQGVNIKGSHIEGSTIKSARTDHALHELEITGGRIELTYRVDELSEKFKLILDGGIVSHEDDQDPTIYSFFDISEIYFNSGNSYASLGVGGLVVDGKFADMIVEQGSNSNGHYIRYDNGTQICWTRMSEFVIDIAIGNIYRSESQIWTYPAAFDDNYPVVVSGAIAALNRWLGITGSPFGGSVSLRGYGATSSSSGYTAYVMAIGRWK